MKGLSELEADAAIPISTITPNIENQVLNFGSGEEISIKDLAKLIIQLTKSNSKLIE